MCIWKGTQSGRCELAADLSAADAELSGDLTLAETSFAKQPASIDFGGLLGNRRGDASGVPATDLLANGDQSAVSKDSSGEGEGDEHLQTLKNDGTDFLPVDHGVDPDQTVNSVDDQRINSGPVEVANGMACVVGFFDAVGKEVQCQKHEAYGEELAASGEEAGGGLNDVNGSHGE